MPLTVTPLNRTTVQVTFSVGMRIERLLDPTNYVLTALDGAFPLTIETITPVFTTYAAGANGFTGSPFGYAAILQGAAVVTSNLTLNSEVPLPSTLSAPVPTSFFHTAAGELAGASVDDYLFLQSAWNTVSYCRILTVDAMGVVGLDRPLQDRDPSNGSIQWAHTSPVLSVLITTTGQTDGGGYELRGKGLTDLAGRPVSFQVTFTGLSTKPRVLSAQPQPDGNVLVTFDRPMRPDVSLTNPTEYQITPSGIWVRSVTAVSETQVLLGILGMQDGDSCQLTVNASGTPHDAAGNPIDPGFNQAAFTGSSPLNARSIFVNRGPIARPPITLQMGTGLTLVSPTVLSLTGGAFGQNLVGLSITLTGTARNDGTYLIQGVLTNNRLRLQASLSLPDADQSTASWVVQDPRNGEIADDPAHVTVRINGVPTRPDAVVGLLGQIVMPTMPAPTDDVQVDYAWVHNPTVEIRRLNSKEFHLNCWNRDNGRLHDTSRHKYRFNNVLPVPRNVMTPVPFQQGTNAVVISPTRIQLNDGAILSSYKGLSIALLSGPSAGVYDVVAVPDLTHVDVTGPLTVSATPVSWTVGDTSDIGAQLPQPFQRDLKYRAFERAYTACLNDPATLRLNAPAHRIAYPPLQRQVSSSFINYEPTGLPESDQVAPWNRVGSQNVSVLASELTVATAATPNGNYIFWNRDVDQTFPHIFAATWRNAITQTPQTQGVWTGVAFGYSDNQRSVVVGYLLVGGVRKIGFLKAGAGQDPSLLSSWTGGVDGNNNPTGAPITLDWSLLHSLRLYQDAASTIRLYLDGGIIEDLRVLMSDLPYLEELEAPFSSLQGSYFGCFSKMAICTSVWDYVRYTVLPLNPLQTAPSIFVSYEGNIAPEIDQNPWTPIGYHGSETILGSNTLLLDSTSAVTSPTPYIGGDYRGFIRLEPLLATNATIVLDINVAVRTQTHGITPNAVTAMIDDGNRLTQLSFLATQASPKISYGGNVLPTQATPPWSDMSAGTPTAWMQGRTLRIENTLSTDGLLYIVDDNEPVVSMARVLAQTNDYILEALLKPLTYTSDPVSGFVGAVAQTYNSDKAIGFFLKDNGARSVVLYGLNAFGAVVEVADIPFEWLNNEPHTYRLVYAAGADLVSLFVDGVFQATAAYSAFPVLPVDPQGSVSFGSSIPGSQAVSVVDWIYCNTWRTGLAMKRYVGIWKGRDPDNLTGYHLPTKITGQNALVVGNALADPLGLFGPAGVTAGDWLVVDDGANKGSYQITSVGLNDLTIGPMWPLQPSTISFRILQETDWTQPHRYRFVKDPPGSFISLLLDADTSPLIVVDYDNQTLPPSSVGLPRLIAGTVPSILWGAFDPTNISQTSWDYVRFGVTRSPTETRITPHHQVLNQRNVIASPEHLTTDIMHPHAGYWSASTGIPPHSDPDFFLNQGLIAFTLLNEGTPLVPSTQTYQVRQPTPISVFVGGLNTPTNVLNNNGFKLNEPGVETKLLVPDDVLYSQLKITEQDSGEPNLIASFSDQEGPSSLGTISYQNQVCLTYDGLTLPESDPTATTPWVFAADDASHVQRSVMAGILTYGTDGVGTTSIYRNATPLPDAIGLGLEVRFRLKVLSDGSGGLGDTQIRFGFSAFGMTLALGFLTTPLGVRYVMCYDLVSGAIVGGTPFDFLDALEHLYRIVRSPGVPTLQIFIDS